VSRKLVKTKKVRLKNHYLVGLMNYQLGDKCLKGSHYSLTKIKTLNFNLLKISLFLILHLLQTNRQIKKQRTKDFYLAI
jgi:hypothetical protein